VSIYSNKRKRRVIYTVGNRSIFQGVSVSISDAAISGSSFNSKH